MSNLSFADTPKESVESVTYPILGILPQSGLGQVFFVWAVLNAALALLPVFDILGNSADLGPTGMPVTIFYSYAVFTLNCCLGLAYYTIRGRAWVQLEEKRAAEERV